MDNQLLPRERRIGNLSVLDTQWKENVTVSVQINRSCFCKPELVKFFNQNIPNL